MNSEELLESQAPKVLDLQVWKKILPYILRHKRHLIFTVVIMILCAVIDILIPLFLGYAVDHFIVPGTTEGLGAFMAVTMATLVFQGITVIFFVRAAMRVEIGIGRGLRRDLFEHLQCLSFSYYNQNSVGYMMARVMSDTARIGDMVAWGLVDLSWALVYALGVIGVMLVLNWRLTLAVLVVVPLIIFFTRWFQSRVLKLNRQVRRLNSQVTGAFNEGITGARTSKTLVIEEQNTGEFSELTGKMYGKTAKMALLNGVFMPIILFAGSVITAVVLAQGGYLVMAGALQFGMLSTFINYTLNIFEPIQQIVRILSDFISTQANIERVSSLLEQEPEITDTPEVIEKYGDTFSPRRENWEPLTGDIEFKDVTFRYPDGGDNVLEHFNLKVPHGSYIAIVGETGAGKSTLVNLLCRFFEPTQGQVLIDGRDYRERSQLWLHSNIGYVLQNPHLFSGTVRENIRYGRLDATDEEVLEAARLVSADKVISKLEHGMDSDVGEGGDRLSTGEKQLISFARAVLANPRIFILDEATSSIDTDTEQLIQNAIAHMLQGRTSFIIAHRLSTVRTADEILVVRGGKIVERGTHRELLNARGYYYDLYTRQFEEEAGKQALEESI